MGRLVKGSTGAALDNQRKRQWSQRRMLDILWSVSPSILFHFNPNSMKILFCFHSYSMPWSYRNVILDRNDRYAFITRGTICNDKTTNGITTTTKKIIEIKFTLRVILLAKKIPHFIVSVHYKGVNFLLNVPRALDSTPHEVFVRSNPYFTAVFMLLLCYKDPCYWILPKPFTSKVSMSNYLCSYFQFGNYSMLYFFFDLLPYGMRTW